MSVSILFQSICVRLDLAPMKAALKAAVEDTAGEHYIVADRFTDVVYLHFEETGSSNTIEQNGNIARSWSLRAMGSADELVCFTLDTCKDLLSGMFRVHNAKTLTVEGLLRRMRSDIARSMPATDFVGRSGVIEFTLRHFVAGGFDGDEQYAPLNHPWAKQLIESGHLRQQAPESSEWYRDPDERDWVVTMPGAIDAQWSELVLAFLAGPVAQCGVKPCYVANLRSAEDRRGVERIFTTGSIPVPPPAR
jgi:hypothetical protein